MVSLVNTLVAGILYTGTYVAVYVIFSGRTLSMKGIIIIFENPTKCVLMGNNEGIFAWYLDGQKMDNRYWYILPWSPYAIKFLTSFHYFVFPVYSSSSIFAMASYISL